MASLADRTIAALRTNHDELVGVIGGLSDEQLLAGSGATEWSVAQVLSHLGSGAEITRATLAAAIGTAPVPDADFNRSVWDRWDALAAQDQASGFISADAELVGALEALDADQRASLNIELGFLPMPLSVAAFAGMRLNEAVQHNWDVRVSAEPAAVVSADAAGLLAEHFATDLAFLLGFTGKADTLAQPAVVAIAGSDYAFDIAEQISLVTAPPAPTATFTGPLESAIRLIAGRLTGGHTPAGVGVEGNVTLDDLRRVFPGS